MNIDVNPPYSTPGSVGPSHSLYGHAYGKWFRCAEYVRRRTAERLRKQRQFDVTALVHRIESQPSLFGNDVGAILHIESVDSAGLIRDSRAIASFNVTMHTTGGDRRVISVFAKAQQLSSHLRDHQANDRLERLRADHPGVWQAAVPKMLMADAAIGWALYERRCGPTVREQMRAVLCAEATDTSCVTLGMTTGRWFAAFQRATCGGPGAPLDHLLRIVNEIETCRNPPWLLDRVKRIESYLAKVAAAEVRVAAHGDVTPTNIIAAESNIAVVDWINLHWGLRYEDPANYVASILNQSLRFPHQRAMCAKWAREFLQSWAEQLNGLDATALIQVLRLFLLWQLTWGGRRINPMRYLYRQGIRRIERRLEILLDSGPSVGDVVDSICF